MLWLDGAALAASGGTFGSPLRLEFSEKGTG